MEEDTKYFCYKLIYGDPMQYLTFPLNIISLILLIYAIAKFIVIKKIGPPCHITLTFISIFLWALCKIIYLYSI